MISRHPSVRSNTVSSVIGNPYSRKLEPGCKKHSGFAKKLLLKTKRDSKDDVQAKKL